MMSGKIPDISKKDQDEYDVIWNVAVAKARQLDARERRQRNEPGSGRDSDADQAAHTNP